jgi:iron complex transport system ATP-binding protein
MMGLDLRDLTVRRGGREVLSGATLAVGPGEFVGLLGPNGAGKTTLLRAALGLEPHEGQSNLARLGPERRARAAAFLPQGREIAWPVAVAEVVALGRAGLGDDGGRAVGAAMARLGLGSLAQRRADALSGGETARVLLARAIAQATPLLLADEPAAGLDPAAQIRCMALLADLAREGRAVVATVHDIALAARHCTRIVLMAGGRIVADGAPHDGPGGVLDPARLGAVFGIRAFRAETPEGPVVLPVGVTGPAWEAEATDAPPRG